MYIKMCFGSVQMISRLVPDVYTGCSHRVFTPGVYTGCLHYTTFRPEDSRIQPYPSLLLERGQKKRGLVQRKSWNSWDFYDLTLQENNPRRFFIVGTIKICKVKYYLAILHLSATVISVFLFRIVTSSSRQLFPRWPTKRKALIKRD